MEGSLADYLMLTKGHLEPSLISSEEIAHIARIAGIFPQLSASGFECRLGEPHATSGFWSSFLAA